MSGNRAGSGDDLTGMFSLAVPAGLAAVAVLRTASVRRRLRSAGATGLRPRQQVAFWGALVALDVGIGFSTTGIHAVRALAFVLVALVAAPLLLWSLPEWWVRRGLATWRLYRIAGTASSPLVAGLVAVGVLVVTRIAPDSPVAATAWMVGGFLAWLPVLSPLTEHRATQPVGIS